MKVLLLALNIVLGIVVPLGAQLWDRRRMSRAEREQVWNFASWGSALYNFGPFSLVAWGYVTRSPRYWWGLCWGAILAEGAFCAQWAINEALVLALSVPAKEARGIRDAFGAQMLAAVALAVLVGLGRALHDAVRGRRSNGAAG